MRLACYRIRVFLCGDPFTRRMLRVLLADATWRLCCRGEWLVHENGVLDVHTGKLLSAVEVETRLDDEEWELVS